MGVVSSGNVPKTHQATNPAPFSKQARTCRRPAKVIMGVLFCPRHSVPSTLDETFLLSPPKRKTYGCLENNVGSWILWSCFFVEEVLLGHLFCFEQWLYKGRKIEMLSSHSSPPLCASDFLELRQETVSGNLFNLYLISWFFKDPWGLDLLSSQWANDCFGFLSFPNRYFFFKKEDKTHCECNTWFPIGSKGSQLNFLY